MQHRRDPQRHEGEAVVPRVVFDYFFLTERDRETEANPMMVMKDEQSGDGRP